MYNHGSIFTAMLDHLLLRIVWSYIYNTIIFYLILPLAGVDCQVGKQPELLFYE